MKIAEFIVPASRMILSDRHGLVHVLLYGHCDNETKTVLFSSLERVCNYLAAAATTEISIHEIDCRSVAQHEQALVMAVRALQNGNEFGYSAAMSAIAHPTAARVLRRDMLTIALALNRLLAGPGKSPTVSTDSLGATNPGAALLH